MIRLIANTDIGSISFDEPQPHERGEDRRGAHGHRQQRRDDAAEDDQRQQEQQREGEHLRAREVLLDLLADLHEGEPAAAGGHARLALDALLQPLGGGVLVHAGAEGGEQVGRAAVARDELGRLAVADGDDRGDVGVAQRARDARDLLARLRRVDRCAEPHERDQVGRRRPSGRALDRVAREDRLRAVVLEVVVVVEQGDDRAAERAREQHEARL